ncbi:MAG: hypothetical protein ACO376_02900, partial [Gammaproteobacteria bacterium]
QNGWMTINEVRELENLNPIGPEGDQHYIQMNMQTLEDMNAEPEPPPEPPPPPEEPATPPEEPPADDEQPDAVDEQ